ncbi:MAG: hypothetical protein RBS80_31690 [Thermoguttaceae bacterium]|jgi:hypothetical protein|nr:hypothetical protein [Thermoguttaceae bacterium]
MCAFHRVRLAWLLAACLIFSGCFGADPAGRRQISGKVTLDGVPLDSGSIHFEPLDGAGGHGSGCVIAGGKYILPATHGLPDGHYRVSISAPEATNQEPSMGAEVPPPVERIPEQYNVRTQLTAQVTRDGSNTFDFELKSVGQ